MPGAPVPELGWPGTKNHRSHSVWLPQPVQELITELSGENQTTGFVFVSSHGRPISGLAGMMQKICATLGVDRAVPHDLRRTFSSKVTGLGHGRDAMDRITNHKSDTITDVYDRHSYNDANRRIMESVADHIVGLATGRDRGTVIRGRF